MARETVYEIYDKTTGEGMGVSRSRYQARKTAKELGPDYGVRKTVVRAIITK